MKVHLIRSAEVDQELFTKVINLLEAVPGPIQFGYDAAAVINFNEEELFNNIIPDIDDFETSKVLSLEPSPQFSRIFPMEKATATWKTLFKKCEKYRHLHNIPANEFVLLLTDIPNKENWFASLDEGMPYNGFVHTDDWDHYIDCSNGFPVSYEIIALMLQKYMFRDKTELFSTVHDNPVGCVNDMCLQKREVILKLRTADICRSCMERIKDKIPMPVIHHALAVMESLRVKMLYAQNFRQESSPSRLLIDEQFRIFLLDYGNIEIKLRPLEKALYILFLSHPEGIFLSSLSDFKQELYAIYTKISHMGILREMQGRIDEMVNALSNSANEKISRIKRVFEEAIGNELARHYYIRGNAGDVRKISLDSGLINISFR